MAGGSSDAAATMVGVNRLFNLGLSMEELMERGVKIGADVPYCIMRGTALAEGIGEVLSPLPPMPQCYILIGKPPVSVSTKFVYGNLRANELERHPDIDGLIGEMEQGNISGMCAKMENVLETVTIPAYPVIQEIKDLMLANGAEMHQVKQEGLFEKLKDKICIGQGYRGQTGKLGVGNCTGKFEHSVKGCPPTEAEIYEFLKEYILNQAE